MFINSSTPSDCCTYPPALKLPKQDSVIYPQIVYMYSAWILEKIGDHFPRQQ